MTGLCIGAVGVVLLVVGLVLTWGIVTLIPCGAVLIIAGLTVDWERVTAGRPVNRGKRS